MPSSGSASSAATIPRPSPWSPPAAPGRCTAPTWRARWAASAPCCRAPRARSAPWACCSPTCGRTICKVFLADLDKVERADARSGLRRAASATRRRVRPAQASANSTCATRASNGRCAWRSTALRHRGRARASSRPSTSACSATSSRSGRIDITALRVIGRTPLDWTPPAARSPQAAPPVPRETRARSGSIRRTAGATCRSMTAPSCGPAASSTGPLLIEERTTTAFVGPRDRLEVDARDDFLVHVGANRMTDARSRHAWRWCRTGSTTSRTRWAG